MTSSLPIRRTATKRSLLLHDGLIFLALCGVTIALFLVTWILFQSFETHREDLGKRWAARGQLDLQQGHPAEAVTALRTALTYRENLPGQLLLAQALADAGHLEEASNYFLNLRETRPGDGFINLQLARLNRKQGDAQEAVNFYRASIFGDWQGDGALRRREVRLELADYLAGRGDLAAARDEIFVAAGNTAETASADVLFGDRLATIKDSPDALTFYLKSLEQKPQQREVLAKAGRLAYALGNFAQAYKLLTEATERKPGAPAQIPEEKEILALAANAHRIPELTLSRELPAAERADHILLASEIAQAHLAACAAGTAANSSAPALSAPPFPVLQILKSRWAAASGQLNKRALERDAAIEDNVTQLINDTETQTVTPCGSPTGDDALLLLLASSTHASQ